MRSLFFAAKKTRPVVDGDGRFFFFQAKTMADESWREAFPEVPTDELDAPGMWSDPNFSLSKSANIGESGEGGVRERIERVESRQLPTRHPPAVVVRTEERKRRRREERRKRAAKNVREAPAMRKRGAAFPLNVSPFSMPLPQSLDRVDTVAKEGGGKLGSFGACGFTRGARKRATFIWRKKRHGLTPSLMGVRPLLSTRFPSFSSPLLPGNC